MGRIACILVADFPLAALIRTDPALRDAALVLSHSRAPHAEVIAVSPKARAAGVRPGATLAQARACVSDLIVALPSSAAQRSAADALCEVAESLSPLVEAGAPGCVWLDLGGLGHFFDSEDSIAAELARRAGRVGLQAAIGIAANKDVARLAAQCGGIRVIAPGMEREFLDWLPLDLLDTTWIDGELAAILARWGIRRLGEIARLDSDALGHRLGRRGVALARIAAGGDSPPLAAHRREQNFTEQIDLDYGIDGLEPMGFVMHPMVDRLVERIAMRGMAAGDILLALGLDDRRRDSRRVAVAAATNETGPLLALLMLSLEAAPPPGAVETIQITIEARTASPAQTDLFAPPAAAPAQLQATLARLTAECGPERVGKPVSDNSHRPEAVRIEPLAPTAWRCAPPACGAGNIARLVMRAIRPALEIEVLCARGAPDFVRGPRLCARVVSLAGPWRRQGEWWRESAFARDYYETALDDGGVYRIFHDLNSQLWFVDGIYD